MRSNADKVTMEKLEEFQEEVCKLSKEFFGTNDEDSVLVETIIVDRTRYHRLHYVAIPYDEMNMSSREHMDKLGRDIMLNLALAQADAKRWWDLTEMAMRQEDRRAYHKWMQGYKRVPIKKVGAKREEDFQLQYKVQYRLYDGSMVTPFKDADGTSYEKIRFHKMGTEHKDDIEQWYQFVKLEAGEVACTGCRQVYTPKSEKLSTYHRYPECKELGRTRMFWANEDINV